MRTLFICDVHIPPRLVTQLQAQGFDAIHVFEIGFETADDMAIWDFAKERDAIIVTKDKDFVPLASTQDGPRIILVCIGNSSNRVLLAKFSLLLPEILGYFETGRRLVELR